MTTVLAVANQKGGVGKTTTSVNLAASLAAAELPTLLIDLDPQGNATSGLGVDKGSVTRTAYQSLIGQGHLEEAIIPSPLEYLRLIPSTMDLIGAEVELVGAEGREQRLRAALEPLRGRFSYIIIDCPPSLGVLTVDALTAADEVIIPLQCEFYALEGLSQLLRTIELIRANFNPHLAIRGILMTMYDGRTNLSAQVMSEVQSHFPKLVFETVIPRSVRLSEAPSFGKPVLLYDIRSRGAEAYLNLAKEIIAHVPESSR